MYEEIAAGGMASIHFGRLLGSVGFTRIVAIKRLRSHRAEDGEFVSMFVDEARVASRIRHPNVSSPLDVVLDGGEIFLVMEYIHGDTLAHLISSARSARLAMPPAVTAAIVSGALRGLHAAHEAVDENRQPLSIIHRDVSPQNIMVGADGVARVLDFGVAKSMYRCQSTQQGVLKGKLCYMAPEQMQTGALDRRVDIFAAGIVLWETLTQQRLFMFDNPETGLSVMMNSVIPRPSELRSQVPRALDNVVMKALERHAGARFQSAREFADAIEGAIPLAMPGKVGEWVERLCGGLLAERAQIVTNIEGSTFDLESTQSGRDFLLWQQGPITPPPVTVRPPPGMVPSPAGEPVTVREAYVEAPLAMEIAYPGDREIVFPKPSQELSAGGRWSRRVWPALAGMALVGMIVDLVSLQMARRTTGASESTPPTVAASRPAAPSGSLTANQPSSSPTVVQLPSAHDSVEPALFGSASTRKKAVASSGGRRRLRHPATKGSNAARFLVKRDCAVPYTIDARGIRRIKPHCR